MDQLTLAATIWGRLEHHLVSTGLSECKTLEIERAHCIAIIAETLGAKPVKAKRAVKSVAEEAIGDVVVEEKLPLIKFPPPKSEPNLRSSTEHTRGPGPSSSLESAMTKRLDQIIDQSINRKVGYSGDDEVGYGKA